MIAAVSARGPSALWYATRGTGAVALVLLTASLVLGVAEVKAWQPAGAPRFAVAAMHRTLSLLAVALLAVHVVTTLLDPFPRVGLVNAVVPFVSSYRPLWMGLGTVAADLLVALVVTSLVRRRLGYRAWRGVHWFAYACWPVAVLHGLGTGSDANVGWMLALTLGCVAAVALAVARRIAGAAVTPRARATAGAAVALTLAALAVWTAQGPLASGWARRAGTPRSVLEAFRPRRAAPARVAAAPADPLAAPFAAPIAGSISQGTSADGTAVVDIRLRLAGGPSGVLRIRLGGQPLPQGGLQMTSSAVTLGPPSEPARYSGRIDFLRNTTLRALVGSPNGRALRLTVDLSLGSNTVSGRLRSAPLGTQGA